MVKHTAWKIEYDKDYDGIRWGYIDGHLAMIDSGKFISTLWQNIFLKNILESK